MVKVKDIAEVYYDERKKHLNKDVYINIDGKTLLANWVHNFDDKIILTVRE